MKSLGKSSLVVAVAEVRELEGLEEEAFGIFVVLAGRRKRRDEGAWGKRFARLEIGHNSVVVDLDLGDPEMQDDNLQQVLVLR